MKEQWLQHLQDSAIWDITPLFRELEHTCSFQQN
jgi:hypothetical protein